MVRFQDAAFSFLVWFMLVQHQQRQPQQQQHGGIIMVAALEQCGISFVCMHNSTCMPGPPDFSDHHPMIGNNSLADAADSDHHCECSRFYTGVDCSIPVENCDDGNHRCYHGGRCVLDDPESLPYCDCSDAVDLATDTRYVGRYCEQAAPDKNQDSFCNHDLFNVETFCLNGGTCNSDFPNNSPIPCRCPIGFKGAYCELPNETYIRDCTLSCENGGLCRLGEEYDPKQAQLYFDRDDGDFMHCECPPGFAGDLCEVLTIACGGIECLNGGICQEYTHPTTGTMQGYCNCDATYDAAIITAFIGEYCQYQTELFCGTAQGKRFFCTNGGVCGNPAFEGCDCPPGTAGPACEFLQETDCTLGCFNGQCKLGQPPEYSSSYQIWLDAENHHNFQYCDCDTGYSGRACEISARNACGDFACLNGGTCEIDSEGNYSCNCRTAVDDARGIFFNGKYCQFASTSICYDDPEENQVYFCTNRGQCQADYTEGCLCREGFGGFSCEFIQGKDCMLDCQNGGTCILGSPPRSAFLNAYWFNQDDYTNWQYCDCPEGYNGKFCEAVEVDCGGFKCLNGGQCTDAIGQPLTNRCNCLDAYDPVNGGIYYDGRYCQFPSTSICYEREEEVYFCMNDGICREDYLSGCVCPPGYAGFSCELLESVDCTLDCGNSGTCRLGIPPGGSQAHAYWYDPDSQDDYQYCECNEGFGGKFCDVQGDDCGKFSCLNGGKCTDETGKAMVDRCNCLDAWEEGVDGAPNVYYDGRFCQYASSSICFQSENQDSSQSFFCMNGGACRANHLEGCDCPDGFTGFSCEFIEGTDCTLDCGEDGYCRIGSPPGGSQAYTYWFDPDARGGSSQYCECRNGVGGMFCDQEGVDCGDFTCLNGGKCDDENGRPIVDRCNCLEAFAPGVNGSMNIFYDGRFCQHASTSVCFESDDEVYFCANNGVCASSPLNGCSCPEGFSGFFCEFAQGTECNLDCGDHGVCRLGSPSAGSHAHAYWFDPDGQNYQYCECDSGYGGKYCEFRGQDCGYFTCLNGGTCDPSFPGRCNCLNAFDEGEGSIADIYFDGRFCQYASTSVCFEGDINGREEALFCMNDGQCRRDPLEGCDCRKGFNGFSCEFITGTADISQPTLAPTNTTTPTAAPTNATTPTAAPTTGSNDMLSTRPLVAMQASVSRIGGETMAEPRNLEEVAIDENARQVRRRGDGNTYRAKVSYGGPDALNGLVVLYDGSILGMSVILDSQLSSGRVEFFFRINGADENVEKITFSLSEGRSQILKLKNPLPVSSGDIVEIGVHESRFPGDVDLTQAVLPELNTAGMVIMIQH